MLEYELRLPADVLAGDWLRGAARAFLRKLWEEADMPKPNRPPRILIGGMASGASVLQGTDAVTKVLDQHKDVLAIEMEAFSVMFAAQTAPLPRPLAIVAKSVCDFGDGSRMTSINVTQPMSQRASSRN